jgi:hypothetical protein
MEPKERPKRGLTLLKIDSMPEHNNQFYIDDLNGLYEPPTDEIAVGELEQLGVTPAEDPFLAAPETGTEGLPATTLSPTKRLKSFIESKRLENEGQELAAKAEEKDKEGDAETALALREQAAVTLMDAMSVAASDHTILEPTLFEELGRVQEAIADSPEVSTAKREIATLQAASSFHQANIFAKGGTAAHEARHANEEQEIYEPAAEQDIFETDNNETGVISLLITAEHIIQTAAARMMTKPSLARRRSHPDESLKLNPVRRAAHRFKNKVTA